MIEVTRLTKVYGGQAALRGVDLAVPAGSILTVLGHNGSGKTTLLRVLATLTRPTAGGGRVGGHDLVREREAVRRTIAFVGHETQLYDDLTARENLAFATALAGESVAADRVTEVLARVGLDAHADARVRTLSSGMRRRVSLARAMLREARVLLLDEPFAGLDHGGVKRLEDFLHGFKAGGGAGVVVTHSLGRALAVADQVVVLSAGRVMGKVAGAEVTEAALQRLVLAATDTDG
jgi:heme ABC exporter ATP-binding subunit CcmA